MNKTSLTGYETLIFQVHSYFEKGWEKSARDNPERYYGWFWIHCFLVKGVWKNDTRRHERMFASGKGKQQK